MKKKRSTRLINAGDILITFICLIGMAVALYLFWSDMNISLSKKDETPIAVVYLKVNTVQRRFVDRNLWERVQEETPVYEGDRIRTSQMSEAITVFDDGTEIEIHENTLIQIYKQKGKSAIEFIGGAVTVKTTGLGGETPDVAPLLIKTGNKVVELDAGSEVSLSAPVSSADEDSGDGDMLAEKIAVTVTKGSAAVREASEEDSFTEEAKASSFADIAQNSIAGFVTTARQAVASVTSAPEAEVVQPAVEKKNIQAGEVSIVNLEEHADSSVPEKAAEESRVATLFLPAGSTTVQLEKGVMPIIQAQWETTDDIMFEFARDASFSDIMFTRLYDEKQTQAYISLEKYSEAGTIFWRARFADKPDTGFASGVILLQNAPGESAQEMIDRVLADEEPVPVKDEPDIQEEAIKAEAIRKEEEDRKAREEAARLDTEAAERIAAEKAAAERAEAERIAAEKAAAERAEAERIAAEKAAAERAEAERIAAEKAAAERAEAERIAAEKAAAERAEAERIAAEKAAAERAEAERIAAEKTAAEKAEAERIAAEKAAAERIAAEKAAAERAEAERIAAEKAAAEKAEAERIAAEKAAAERAEAERIAAEKAAAERAEAERIAAEKAVAERAEAERIAAEKAEAERIAAEKAEAERIAAEKAAAERAEAERIAAEKAAAEKAEAERIAAEKAATEKAEAERIAAAKAAAERAEAERIAAEKAAAERAEAERIAAEKAAAERARRMFAVSIPSLQSPAAESLFDDAFFDMNSRIVFSWMPLSEAVSYKLTIKEKGLLSKTVLNKKVNDTQYTLTDFSILDEGDFEWSVTGIMADGTESTKAESSFTVRLDPLERVELDKTDLFRKK